MTHHCPEVTNSVTSDSNDLDMWNRSHTANEGIRYNQESVKQVYLAGCCENPQMNGCNQCIKTL